MRPTLTRTWLGALVATSLVGSGCSTILGIHEEPYEPLDATATDGPGTGDGAGSGDVAERGDSGVPGDADATVDAAPPRDSNADVGLDSTRKDGAPPTDGGGGEAAVNMDAADGEAACTCLPLVPPGWNGPVAFLEEAGSVASPCPQDYPVVVAVGNSGFDAGTATCSQCTCDTSTLGCSATQVNFNTDSTCMAASQCDSITLEAGACAPTIMEGSMCSGPLYVSASASVQAACTPGGGVLDATGPSFASATVACAADGGVQGCSVAGMVCVPPRPSGAELCIYRIGVVAGPCPMGYGTTYHTYAGSTDGRGCSMCRCGGATGTCTTYVKESGAVLCVGDGGASAPGTSVDGCTPLGTATNLRVTAPATVDEDASCPASGVSVQGMVTTTGEITFCCH